MLGAHLAASHLRITDQEAADHARFRAKPNPWASEDILRIEKEWSQKPPQRVELLHLARYFRMSIGHTLAYQQEYRQAESAWEAEKSPQELFPTRAIRETRFPYVYADSDNNFTFQPGVLYLGHTLEDIEVAPNEQWQMWPFFHFGAVDHHSQLRTNFTASLLHPGTNLGHPGPVTYEIQWEGDMPLTINLSLPICPTGVFRLSGIPLSVRRAGENFSYQQRGVIKLGDIHSAQEEQALLKAICARR